MPPPRIEFSGDRPFLPALDTALWRDTWAEPAANGQGVEHRLAGASHTVGRGRLKRDNILARPICAAHAARSRWN
jgi:hypothetical protein